MPHSFRALASTSLLARTLAIRAGMVAQKP
jgi:hypothetical protein